jgi:hypothetical protein
MFKNIKVILLQALLSITLSTNQAAFADIVTLDISGKIYDAPAALAPYIFSNDAFRALISYDTSTTDYRHFDDPESVARYVSPYTQIALRIGSFNLSVPNAKDIPYLGEATVNDNWDSGTSGYSPDELVFQVGNWTIQGQQHSLYGSAPVINGYHLQSFIFGFFNSDGTALSSNNLPETFDRTRFFSLNVGFWFNSGEGQFEPGIPLSAIWGNASITNIIQVASPVPLPNTALLFGSTLIGFTGLKRNKHRRD